MERKEISTFKIAAAYIGTIVGAGFATGQEILRFFACYGKPGILGLAVSALLFAFFGYVIMFLGHKVKAESHLDVIRFAGKGIVTGFTDLLITFFLFGAFAAMIAGTGALFSQQFGIKEWIGNVVMAVLTAVTVLIGFEAVINSISFVVPFLLLSVTGISLYTVIGNFPALNATAVEAAKSGLVNGWLPAAILYVSYNTVISISVLGPLGAKAKDRKMIRRGSVFGGLGLGLGSLFIYLALSSNLSEISHLEVPMIYIAGKIRSAVQILYAVILIAEIYTTAVGSLYGFAVRIGGRRKPKTEGKNKSIIILTTVGAFIAGQFGFSNIIKYLYPLVGYGGLLMLASLVFAKYKKEKAS